ncbi:hypothetical protein P152DRAFT_517827 [Eremomyces bilateralis CBS 781.70]|uniref:Uncharacterized protein n=1 Tax=Eremomyces bilateralis CBS 781.70 TaxID=1392243 RepID=A0A6G1FQS2_9PEZI|nr:uncharacterized protein P152DRAFT_517827 [Eremomyces bilateralis CBS 781.70]KAF1808041.1 hypothetical protein P152DRAFT_517827 [Eremomyces bilateralis CBS 781.70]
MKTPADRWAEPRPKPKPSPPERSRVVLLDDSVSVWGWPSRGGLIVLEQATALDFEMLQLDSVNLALARDDDRAREDEHCQRLLWLGARWFDSRERYGFVWNLSRQLSPAISAVERGEQPAPTRPERWWVRVAFSNGQDPHGGFWVGEWDSRIYGSRGDRQAPVHLDAAQIALARNMGEKCRILEALGATYFDSLDSYRGEACVNAWHHKHTGEFGPLVIHDHQGVNGDD